jgi:dTDP-glucose 4,6-dehydratase
LLSDVTEPTNLGSTDEISILTLAHEVIEMTQSRSPIVFGPIGRGDPKRRQPDISRARTGLGWQPTVSRHDGLRRTADYFRAQLPVQPTAQRQPAGGLR